MITNLSFSKYQKMKALAESISEISLQLMLNFKFHSIDLGVFIQWNGMVEWNGGMEWNGLAKSTI